MSVSSKTILVVDDDALFLEAIGYSLTQTKYTMLTARTYREAIEVLHRHTVDLLLQDLSLPDGYGIDIIKQAKSLYPDIRIIIITGHADFQSAVEGIRNGIYDYIEKPIDSDILLHRLQRAIVEQDTVRKNIMLQEQLSAQNTELRQANVQLKQEIAKRRETEERLYQAQRQLEDKVEKRTVELKEVNTALRVLLQKRESDSATLSNSVLSSVRNRLLPHIKGLERSSPSPRQKAYIEAIKTDLQNLVDSFFFKLSSTYINLTPTELHIAADIREGFTSKEIAERNNLSVRTVEVHRENIRKKLGLRHKKINLRSYLLSLDRN